jgi:hypothetical protein
MSILESIDYDKLEGYTPELIANLLFSKNPSEPCSHMILAYADGSDILYYFEILITILLEGLDICANGLNTVDLSNFNEDFILALDPWFNSIGFKLKVDTYDYNNKNDNNNYTDYYCKAKVRTPLHETFFIMKNIDKNYHFLLNGLTIEQNKQKTNINEVSCIFINDDNKVYKIWFDFIGSK